MKFNLLFFSILTITNFCVAQQDSLQIQSLGEVTINATKIKEKKEKLPLSVSTQDFTESQDSRQQLSFNDYLIDVPGVFTLNANNFSQDLRVSIRGFGARSAFGIRGVKIIVDGIPETTPDGQGQIDNLNLGAIKNIEVVRGPSSLLYGNASGGIISINTEDAINETIKAGITIGSYSMQLYQLGVGFKAKNTRFIFRANHTQTDGYRDFSGFKSTNANLRVFHKFSSNSKLNFQINYTDSPFAQDAGSLNADSVTENRRQARQRNVDFNTQETISQLKLGANYKYRFNNKIDINTYGFFASREFQAKLPFRFGGAIDLKRNYFGHGFNVNLNSDNDTLINKLQLGYELAFQNDERQRFFNEEGTIGDQTFYQDEIFNSFGLYLIDHFTVDKFLFRGGVRYNSNTLKAEDRLLEDGNDSGSIEFNAFNYSFGVNYNVAKMHYMFAGLSTSFETPVLSELSNNPNGNAGFNLELGAQEATNYEIGYKWNLDSTQLEAVLFYIDTKNDLVSFELEAFPDRDFFRSVGSTIRRGVEMSFYHKFNDAFKVNSSYTYSDFKYAEYMVNNIDLSGRLLPAIPKHRLSLNISYKTNSGFYIQLQGQHIGSLYTNDINSIKDDAYTLLNLRLRKVYSLNKVILSPFIGINNLLNEAYNDNVRINAFGGRFFEPGAGFNMFGGLRLKI